MEPRTIHKPGVRYSLLDGLTSPASPDASNDRRNLRSDATARALRAAIQVAPMSPTLADQTSQSLRDGNGQHPQPRKPARASKKKSPTVARLPAIYEQPDEFPLDDICSTATSDISLRGDNPGNADRRNDTKNYWPISGSWSPDSSRSNSPDNSDNDARSDGVDSVFDNPSNRSGNSRLERARDGRSNAPRLSNVESTPRGHATGQRSGGASATPTRYKRAVAAFQKHQNDRRDAVHEIITPLWNGTRAMHARFFDGHRSETDAAVTYLRVANVECSPNDAHPSLNFLTGLLALVTGVHNRNDLSTATRPLFRQDSEIHHAEASVLLARINRRFPALAKTPFDATGVNQGQADALAERMKHVFALIGESHSVDINLSIVHVENGRKKKRGTQAKLFKAQPWQGANEQIEQTGYLLHDRALNKFMPMRTMPQLTNPYLSSATRYRNKSFFGKARALFADVGSRLGSMGRVDAVQLDDAELYERAIDGRTGKVKIKGAIDAENEYIKEWEKRTDTAYSEKKPPRRGTGLFRKLRSVLPFTSNIELTNPFKNLSNAEIDVRLNAPDSRVSRKEKALLKETRRLNFLKAKTPENLNPLPPTPVAFAPIDLVEDVLRDFDALLKPDGGLRTDLFPVGLNTTTAISMQQARASVVRAFMNGNKSFLRPALDFFRDPIEDPANALAGHEALYEHVRKLRRSILALEKGSRPAAHERPAEIAGALRACDFPEADVQKFFETSLRVMEARREMRVYLRDYVLDNAEHPEKARAFLRAASDARIVRYARHIVASRNQQLQAALNEKVELDANIEDRIALLLPSSDDSPTQAAIIRALHAEAGTIEFNNVTTEMQAQSRRLEARINAFETASLDRTQQAEMRIAHLEKLATVWSEVNNVWKKCDALSESTLTAELHDGLLHATRRELQKSVGTVIGQGIPGREA